MQAGGYGLTMDEWFEHPDLGKLLGRSLIAYNSHDSKIHWFSVDNNGTAHEHLGVWKAKDHFYMDVTEMTSDGQYVEKIELFLKGKDVLEMRYMSTMNGKEKESMSATYRRVRDCVNP